jgi:polar amino acid transport system substrate-binding protein
MRRTAMKRTLFVSILAVVLTFIFIAPASAGNTLDRILKRGEIIVGTSGAQPPMNFKTKSGGVIGFDAEIARLIAWNMGVEIKFETMPFAQLLPALEAGKVDLVISSMSMIPKRNLKVAFVGPYYISGKGILTDSQKVASLKEAGGLNSPEFTVAALKDSTSQIMVQSSAPQAKLVKVGSYKEAVDMLLQDKIDALIADFPFCALAALRFEDKGLIAGGDRFTFEPLGIAVPEDTLLINWLENFLKMLNGTKHLENLQEEWFKSDFWVEELQ